MRSGKLIAAAGDRAYYVSKRASQVVNSHASAVPYTWRKYDASLALVSSVGQRGGIPAGCRTSSSEMRVRSLEHVVAPQNIVHSQIQ
jgi:hypothetical protein